MNPSTTGLRRRAFRRWWPGFALAFSAYVLSIGPVAWATNDGMHPAYLPDKVWVLYYPLAPLLRLPVVESVTYFYTVILWEGFPAGYTTP